ncbi:MAG: TGS domain-containing protein [Planctomycetota bacterium]
MPANLTPQYSKAEEEYRRAQTAEEKVVCLERMLQLIPKHKGTEKLQADLKTKLKETRDEVTEEKKTSAKKGKSARLPRQGAGQVILVGAPNSGKSRILAELTHAKPEVAPYPFTTRELMPGMMPWEDVVVQLVDTPPITDAHFESAILSLVRSADAVLLCMDGSSDDAPDQTHEVLRQFEARKTVLDNLSGFKEDDFSVVHVKSLLVVTHADDPGCPARLEYYREAYPHSLRTLLVELERADSITELRDEIYRLLGVIRVYTKPPGRPADMTLPFTLPIGGTVEDLATKVHRDLAAKLKFAKVWGDGAHDGQSVGPEHVLFDKNVVELHA